MTLEEVRIAAMEAVFGDKAVSPLEYSVFGVIADHYATTCRPCLMTNREIGDLVGVHPSTASRAVRRLADMGHIETSSDIGMRIIRPADWRKWAFE